MGICRRHLVFSPSELCRINVSIAYFLCLILLSASISGFADERGRTIMEKVSEAQKSKSIKSRWKMILIDKKGRKRVRELITYAKEEDNLTKSITKFVKPEDVKNTGFLQMEKKKGESVQYLYIPALKKVRRIPEGERSGRFMGSDFTYEDMESRDIDKDQHTFLREEKLEGMETYVIESKPKNIESSQYSKVISWIRKDIYLPLKIEFYNKRGEHFKTLTVKKFDLIDGQWLATDTVVEDYKRKHKTEMIMLNVELNKKINDSIFSIRMLRKSL